MKTYYYNLDSQQALHFAGLKTGEKMVIVVPLQDKLLKDYINEKCSFLTNGVIKASMENIISILSEPTVKGISNDELPYPLGARVGLRETWKLTGYINEAPALGNYSSELKLIVEYKAGGYKHFQKGEIGYYNLRRFYKYENEDLWRSSQCMSRDAIRFWGIVEDVKVCQVQDITTIEMASIYGVDYLTMPDTLLRKMFIDWFNRRYKDRWTWEQNPYCEIVNVRKE